MAILSANFNTTGEQDLNPRIVRIVCDDDIDTVTADGYANDLVQQGNYFQVTDEVHINYGTNSASFNIFTPTIDGLSVTLSPSVALGNVTLPVADGNVAIFVGTDGSLEDSGATFSDPEKTKIVMANGPLVVDNLVSAADVTGTVKDAGFSMIRGVTSAWGGGGVSHAFSTTGVTGSMAAHATLTASANNVAVTKTVTGVDQITVSFSADPGAGTVIYWTATK